jgi:deazaflavin-dependent oxidoreductase (nitroreductase family)
MPEKVGNAAPPEGFKRLLFRAPIWLYKVGLGGLMGGRFLLLKHTGRKSGKPRQTVLEVVDFDAETGTYFVASGFGKTSDWFQNIVAKSEVAVQAGRNSFKAQARPLAPVESGQAMIDYAHRNPRAAKELMRLCGYKVDGSDEDYYFMGHDIIPFVALVPQE